MRKPMRNTLLSTAFLLCAAAAAPHATQAAPRQIVVLVAEGLSPQMMELGTSYVKRAQGEDAVSGFEELRGQAKTRPAGADTLAGLHNLLKNAAAQGYKTGLVTTDDVTKVAPLFYGLAGGNGPNMARTLVNDVKFDFLAGGGRGAFVPQGKDGSLRTDAVDLGADLTKAGGTAIFDADALETVEEIKGKALVLQSDASLTYAIDHDAAVEGGLSDLTALALNTLSRDNAPFVLVIHDTLLAKALAAKDSPAVAGQFQELDNIVTNVLSLREESANLADFGFALLSTGAAITPRFAATAGERSNTLFILTQLLMSYSKAGATLKGTDEAGLTNFATEEYIGWKLTPENRATLLAGTLDPETAIRASYEPALKIGYEPIAATPAVYTIGLDLAGDLVQTLNALALTKPALAAAAP